MAAPVSSQNGCYPYEPPSACCTGTLISLTFLVMSILAVTNVVGGLPLGAVAVSLGGVRFLQACRLNKKEVPYPPKIVDLIMGLVPIVFGSLAIAGVLSGFTVGWVLVGTSIVGCCVCTMMAAARNDL